MACADMIADSKTHTEAKARPNAVMQEALCGETIELPPNTRTAKRADVTSGKTSVVTSARVPNVVSVATTQCAARAAE